MRPLRNVFLTGASSGIGRAISLELARPGAKLVLAARRRGELETLAEEVRERGGTAFVEVLDVTDTERTRGCVLRWDDELGGLDLVLANAGVDLSTHGVEVPLAEVLRVFSVNTLGALATLVPVAPRMVARGKGTLAAVTSLAGMRGLAGHAAYSASKAAVSTYLEALRVDVHGHGVDVVDVRPGFVDTPMTRDKRFPMPFLLDSTRAARLTVDGLRRGTPVVEYPFALARAMDFAEKLPDALWRRVAERLPR